MRDKLSVYKAQQIIRRPILRSPIAPTVRGVQNGLIFSSCNTSLGFPFLFLSIQESQKENLGEMLYIFHDPTAVVVTAQDVAGAPDVVGKGITGLWTVVHGQPPRQGIYAHAFLEVKFQDSYRRQTSG